MLLDRRGWSRGLANPRDTAAYNGVVSTTSRASARTGGSLGTIRLIGGKWKRTKLQVPHKPGLRPTPDRVRETLFNWLGQDLTGWRVLDVFAGTGALALEAASRGAREVVALERDAGLADNLRKVAERLGAQDIRVSCVDAFSWLAQETGRTAPFDLILLDPPFQADRFVNALRAVEPFLSERGIVYLEADRAFDAEELARLGWLLHRQGRAGAVHYHCLHRLNAQGTGTTLVDRL